MSGSLLQDGRTMLANRRSETGIEKSWTFFMMRYLSWGVTFLMAVLLCAITIMLKDSQREIVCNTPKGVFWTMDQNEEFLPMQGTPTRFSADWTFQLSVTWVMHLRKTRNRYMNITVLLLMDSLL